jgi:hypothetical protein
MQDDPTWALTASSVARTLDRDPVLARLLGPDQPTYGLRARGLDDGESIPSSPVEIAADYVDAVRRVQPRGPYMLGGFCLGGAVAVEMAAQLAVAKGDRGADPARSTIPATHRPPLFDLVGRPTSPRTSTRKDRCPADRTEENPHRRRPAALDAAGKRARPAPAPAERRSRRGRDPRGSRRCARFLGCRLTELGGWFPPPMQPALGADEVAVWRLPPETPRPIEAAAAPYLGVSPESVRVARGPTGKPELEGSNLAVSLAHSGAAVLVAIASAGDVGVDVEALGRDITDWQLVEQALKKGERWAVRANGRSSRCRYPTIRQPLLSKGGSQGCVSTRRGARTLRPRRIGSSRLATLIVL